MDKKEEVKTGIREKSLDELVESVKSKDNIHFLHSGDMGDIVAGLASVKELFELTGKRAVLHLDTSGGIDIRLNNGIRDIISLSTIGKGMKFDKTAFDFIHPLLMAQPYIEDVVEYSESNESLIDVNLNVFRKFAAMMMVNEKFFSNIMYCQQLACFLVPGYKGGWLTLPPGVSESVELPAKSDGSPRDIAVSRSSRYHSCQILYSSMCGTFEEGGLFMGTEGEYQSFIECTRVERGKFPRVDVRNALDIAAIQSRCGTVMSNPTLAFWIAVGLAHRKIVHELAGSRILFNTFIPEYRRCVYIHDDNFVSFDFGTGKISEKSITEKRKEEVSNENKGGEKQCS